MVIPNSFQSPMKNQIQAQKRRTRNGLLSMELVLTLPILLIVLMAMLEFSMLFFARGAVLEASRLAARKATFPGTTHEQVVSEVGKLLSPRLRSAASVYTEIGPHPGDVVGVSVQIPMSVVAPDLLWPIGYSLQGQFLIGETRMIRE